MTERRIGLRLVSMAVALWLIALAGPPSTAFGDKFWDQACDPSVLNPCTADNFEHTYCWGADFDGENWREAGHYALRNLAEQTRFTRNYVGGCTENTDIVFAKFHHLFSRGRYNCLSATPQGNCQKARVLMNPDLINDDLNRKKTACHEVGHSGGLDHSDDVGDCMKRGHVYSGHEDYHGHHVSHLDDN